jgi:uncharacterized damage-inducible protein DinB
MSRLLRSSAVLLAALLVASPLTAQAPTTGWRAEFITVLNAAEQKYVTLAEAMPADKMTWRPGEGVRSVSEAFLHVAGANYGLAGRLGAAAPSGVDLRNLERSTTDKAAIVAHLRAGFAHFRNAVIAFPETAPERMVPFFGGQEVTARYFLYFNADHNGEHLGQLIAYARTNGVTPPWSAGGN